MLQGFFLSAFIAILGYCMSLLPLFQSLAIGSLTLALLIGIILANLPYTNTILKKSTYGLQFSQSKLLRIGVALFGLNLTWQNIFELGAKVFWLDFGVVTTILISGYFIGTRLLKIDKDTAILTAAGSGICGAAAVMATQDIIKAQQSSTSMAVATVVSFGTIAMLIYPLVYKLGFIPEIPFGVYIGATVHEVAQVVAASETLGDNALKVAIIVKLTRVFMLLPFLMILGYFWRNSATLGARRLQVPFFLLGFLAALSLNSAVVKFDLEFAQTFIDLGRQTAMLLLALAMAALGLNTRLSTWRNLGLKPFLLALILFLMLFLGGFIAIKLIY